MSVVRHGRSSQLMAGSGRFRSPPTRGKRNLDLDTIATAVQTYPVNPSPEGSVLATFNWTGQLPCGARRPFHEAPSRCPCPERILRVMDGSVLIVCEGFAADFYGSAVPGSYFVGLEERPGGGVTVLWTDDPEDAAVFDGIASAEAFARQDPLTLFEVSFARVSGSDQPPAAAPASGAEPTSLADEMRAMGLM